MENTCPLCGANAQRTGERWTCPTCTEYLMARDCEEAVARIAPHFRRVNLVPQVQAANTAKTIGRVVATMFEGRVTSRIDVVLR
jgi:hypothetical protein